MVIDTIEYINMLLELTKEGKKVSLQVEGNSMSPFLINERDIVYFGPLVQLPKKGDIALFQREDGSYILHRVYKVLPQGYLFLGDNQNQCDIEGPLPASCIRAVVESVERKGKAIGPGDFWWWFFRVVWIRIVPFRRGCKYVVSRITLYTQ